MCKSETEGVVVLVVVHAVWMLLFGSAGKQINLVTVSLPDAQLVVLD